MQGKAPRNLATVSPSRTSPTIAYYSLEGTPEKETARRIRLRSYFRHTSGNRHSAFRLLKRKRNLLFGDLRLSSSAKILSSKTNYRGEAHKLIFLVDNKP